MKPLCFVLMPFNKKRDERGREIDFNAIYSRLIAPAISAADMEPIRADEEQVGGSIHKPMYERLMLCEYAVADLTTANPNVYYELGVRHALRPHTTVMIFAEGTGLPFDIAYSRCLPYAVGPDGQPAVVEDNAGHLTALLRKARADRTDDSPLFQLIDGLPRVEIDHAKTDSFRDRVVYAQRLKDKLRQARGTKEVAAVTAVAQDPEMANLADVEAGVIVDLYLSYRDVKGYREMVELYERMPRPLQCAKLIREQLGFALNRMGWTEDAERKLAGVIEEFGPSSETNGLLGRVYKDRWSAAREQGRTIEARGYLKKAIATYTAGFEADWRDAYPGVNAVTLMEMEDRPGNAQAELLPVVRYAATRKAKASGDYWDYATLLELAVIARDPDGAMEWAAAASAAAKACWEVETTAQQLDHLAKNRAAKGEDVAWVQQLRAQLLALPVCAKPA